MRFRLPLLLLVIVLLTSCAGDKRAYRLDGQSVSRAWFIGGGRVVEVLGPSHLVDALGAGYDERAAVDDEAMSLRDRCYDSLAGAMGQDDGLMAAAASWRKLASSDFPASVGALAGGFDEEAFIRDLRGVGEHYVYDLVTVTDRVEEDELDSFLPLWLTMACT